MRLVKVGLVSPILASAALGITGGTASAQASGHMKQPRAPKRGSWYVDSPAMVKVNADTEMAMLLTVSADGRRVSVALDDLYVDCPNVTPPNDLVHWNATTAKLSRGGAFTAVIKNKAGPNYITGDLTLQGQFFTNGRAVGSFQIAGSNATAGCQSSGTWTARLQKGKPPKRLPRRFTPTRFTGTTSAGQPVVLFRTSEGHIVNPSFGLFDCGKGRGVTEPINDVQHFGAPIGRNGYFESQGTTPNHGMIDVWGNVTSPRRIRGTFDYTGDGCEGEDNFTVTTGTTPS